MIYKSMYSAINSKYNEYDVNSIIQVANRRYGGSECVYFVSDGTGMVKIGKTNNVIHRISSLQVGNARKLRLLAMAYPHMTQNVSELEKEIQHNYWANHVLGEHYRLDDDDILRCAHVVVSDFFCYRLLGTDTKMYYDVIQKKNIELFEAISPEKMKDRISDEYKRKVYADDCIVGIDLNNQIYDISIKGRRCRNTNQKAKFLLRTNIHNKKI